MKKKRKPVWRLSVPLTFETYGQMVKWLREQNKMTQKELAEKIGSTQPALARLENTTKSPSLRRMLKISNVFNLEMSAPTFGSLEDRRKQNDTI